MVRKVMQADADRSACKDTALQEVSPLHDYPPEGPLTRRHSTTLDRAIED